MNYEILVIDKEKKGRTAKHGDLVTHKHAGWAWKTRELSNRFDIIPFSGEPKEIAELFDRNRGYYYDFSTSQFRYTLTDEIFNPDLALGISDLPADATNKSAIVAQEIEPNWQVIEPNVCKFLHPYSIMSYPTDQNWTPIRNYWYEKFRPFGASVSGIREILAVLKFGNYGGFGWRGGNLTINSATALLLASTFTTADKEWMRWIWRISPI